MMQKWPSRTQQGMAPRDAVIVEGEVLKEVSGLQQQGMASIGELRATGCLAVHASTLVTRKEHEVIYLYLAVGGVLGVWARYGLTRAVQGVTSSDFPFGTLVVNVAGSFILAFLFVLTLERLTLSPPVRTGILTGGLGAFTTFSTFIMETMVLFERGETLKAASYLVASVVLGLLAAFAGLYLSRKL